MPDPLAILRTPKNQQDRRRNEAVMLSPSCSRCGGELEAPGALLFGPPDDQSRVKKLHLCVGCFAKVVRFLDAARIVEYVDAD